MSIQFISRYTFKKLDCGYRSQFYPLFPFRYDVTGEKVGKTKKEGDQLDKLLDRMDNPDFWRTVHDKAEGKDVVLQDEDIAIMDKLKSNKYPDLVRCSFGGSFFAYFINSQSPLTCHIFLTLNSKSNFMSTIKSTTVFEFGWNRVNLPSQGSGLVSQVFD